MRKVYSLLSAQLAWTVIVAVVCTFSQAVRSLLLRTQLGGCLNTLVYWPTFACLFGLRWKKDECPANYVLLGCLTLCISLDVGMACAILYREGLSMLIVQAASITTAMLLCLTAYALYSGADFSFLTAFLACSVWGLVIGRFLYLLLGTHVMDSALAWFGAAVFSGYILYDTNRVANKIGYDDYIVGTAELYLDILNFFLHIWWMPCKSQRKNRRHVSRLPLPPSNSHSSRLSTGRSS